MNKPLRLLLVEDSEDDAALLIFDLRCAGYQPAMQRVETADALELALQSQGWDLVISDYHLPRFDASAALKVVKQAGIDIPFIIVSGAIGEDTAVACMKAGAHDFIMKGNLARLAPAIDRELRDAEERRGRKVTDGELRRTFSLLRATLDSTVDAILAVDKQGQIQIWNQKLLEMWSIPDTVIESRDTERVTHVMRGQLAHAGTTPELAVLTLVAREGASTELAFSDGRMVECRAEEQIINGASAGHVWSFRDITDRKRAEANLQHQALHDALTGFPNRVLLYDRLRQALLIATREGGSAALLMLDLDRFKEVNDTFGHQAGDRLLQQVALRFQSVLRESDTVARLGGDEFAVLLPNADTTAAGRCAQNLLDVTDAPFTLEGQVLSIGTSIGIALFPSHGDDASTLLRRADVAMYVAKRSGTKYAFYSPEQDRNTANRLSLMNELRTAIEENQLVLHYQPVVQITDRKLVRFEALVRWRHPRQGLIMPNLFIPLAEQSGMISLVSRWVIGAVCRQARAFHDRGICVPIAVNLSVRDLQDLQLPDILARMARENGVTPHALEIEITESAIMSDPGRALRVLGRLRAMGVGLSIDDFGTGYSSLSYLSILPVNELKIDRSFVSGMGQNENDLAIVRATIDLAHSLRLRTVAEGVEDEATWNLLAGLGCDTVQGYYVSRPIPAADAVTWVAQHDNRHEVATPRAAAPITSLRRGSRVLAHTG